MTFPRIILPSCPKCKELSLKVIETRKSKESIRRRKKCELCGYRITTHEVTATFFEQAKKCVSLTEQIKGLFGDQFTGQTMELALKQNSCKCIDCHFNIDMIRCSFDLPEYDTDESFDCIHYQSVEGLTL